MTAWAAVVEQHESVSEVQAARAGSAVGAARRDGRKLHVFELLDTVFTAFESTHVRRGKHYALQDLLRVQRHATFQFQHRSVPYVGTVAPLDGHDATWLNIKLCNSGFEFAQKECRLGRTPKLMPEDWIALPEQEYSPYFVALCAAARFFLRPHAGLLQLLGAAR